jgi:RimJ/RimL family protein N-acetyltransferase
MSFNSTQISWIDHVEWFTQKLSDENTMILIFQSNNSNVGVVRIELKEKAVIGISIATEFRGKKLASEMLIMACEVFRKEKKNPIFAYIKKDNIASIKSFKKAGFTFRRETIINGFESVELIFEKC